MIDVSGAVGVIMSGYRQTLGLYRADVTGDPAELNAAATRDRGQADQVRAVADAIIATARTLAAGWEAPEQRAFNDAAVNLATSMIVGTEQELRRTADRLTSAATALTKARSAVDGVIASFEGQRRTLVAQGKSVPESQVQALFDRARQAGVQAIRDVQRIALGLDTELGALFGSAGPVRLPEQDINSRFRVPGYAPVNARWPTELPLSLFGSMRMTQEELRLLNTLTPTQRLQAATIAQEAEAMARRFYPEPVPHEPSTSPRTISPDGGHANAFKHTYWSARLAQSFGPAWAEQFTTAHETVVGNRPPGESMDLFNNMIGRQIAAEYPTVDRGVLADRVREAVANGRTVIIDLDGNIRYSERVHTGHTGH